MLFESLKSLVQPHLSTPVEELYQAFRSETGHDDLDRFLAHLEQTQLISVDVSRHVLDVTGVELSDSQLPDLDKAGAPAPVENPLLMMGLIGEGSMGKIHLAKDLGLRRKVAFKELKPEVAGRGDIVERFLSEVQITAQLDHPNVVPVYRLHTGSDGALSYSMKLVQGKELKDLINETRELYNQDQPVEGEYTLTSRLEVFLKVCDALAYAHNKGVVHRDLKPANIMVGRHTEVYVMDWGMARPIASFQEEEGTLAIDVSREDEMTLVGEAVGTPRYMSPEQAAGRNTELDGRSDLYALGAILFELVCLKPAFDGRNIRELMKRVMRGDRDPVVHISDGVKIAP